MAEPKILTRMAEVENQVKNVLPELMEDIDASRITSGTLDIARIPAAALERLVSVTNLDALLKLTSDNVQVGDTIQVEAAVTIGGTAYPAGSMFRVVDASVFTGSQTASSVASGLRVYTAGAAATAGQLATARTISLSGDVSGSVVFSGASDVEMQVTLEKTVFNSNNQLVFPTGATLWIA